MRMMFAPYRSGAANSSESSMRSKMPTLLCRVHVMHALSRAIGPMVLAAVLSVTTAVSAQDEDEVLVDGRPIENAVVGRNLALRIRGEVQATEENEDIIDEDVQYGRFPSRLYAAEAKLYQADRLSVAVSLDRWENQQGVDASRIGWSLRTPLTGATSLTLTYRRREADDVTTKHYAYVAIGHYLSKSLYSYSRARYTTQPDAPDTYQISEYLTWSPHKRFRLGGQAAAMHEEDDDLTAWYARIFSTYFLVEDQTSLRLEARHYDSVDIVEFQDYKAFLYQRVANASFIRFGYRFYDDSDGLSSQAYGVKVRHFFSPNLAAHVGYRRYDHSDGPDMDTLLAGFQWLM